MISNIPVRISEGIRMIAGTDSDNPVSCNAHEVISQQLVFVRLAALSSRPDQKDAAVHYEKGHEKLLAAFYDQQIPWATVIVGDGSVFTFYLGIPSHGHYGPLLHSVFPGIDFAEETISAADIIAWLSPTPYLATMTGNPAPLTPEPSRDMQQTPSTTTKTEGPYGIDLFLQATRGHCMAYVVYAQPILTQTVEGAIRWFNSEELEVRSTYLRRGTIEENNNPEALRYCELLLAAKEKFSQGQKTGMWQVRTLVLADHPTGLACGIQALIASFANPANKPQPLRVRRCNQGPYSEESIPGPPPHIGGSGLHCAVPVGGLTRHQNASLGRLRGSVLIGSVHCWRIRCNRKDCRNWHENETLVRDRIKCSLQARSCHRRAGIRQDPIGTVPLLATLARASNSQPCYRAVRQIGIQKTASYDRHG